MLRQRVITAVLLLIVLIATLSLATPLPFMILMALFVSCALWEWLRLTLGRPVDSPVRWVDVLGAVVMAVVLMSLRDKPAITWVELWALMSLIWCLVILPFLFRVKPGGAPRNTLLTLFGPFALLAAWAALIAAHARGVTFLLTLLAVVWVADIGAYFTGRAFGKHKLAPHISPGKTREGAYGGIACVLLLVGISAAFPTTFGGALAERWTLAGALLIAVVLAVLSIAGDLFESLLKRRAGYKDSSNLLPGHGGVLDRIDALIPVLPLALLLS